MRTNRSRATRITLVGCVVLAVAATGTAVAATGGPFTLGEKNKAGKKTVLTNTGKGPALKLRTKKKSTPPLNVSGNRTKVKKLNADYVDGVSVEALQRRVNDACGPRQAIRSIADDGSATCVDVPDVPVIHTAVVAVDGALARGTATSSAQTSPGAYSVRFPVNVRECTYTASIGHPGAVAVPASGSIGVTGLAASEDGVFVRTYDAAGVATNRSFMLTVIC